jgi:hypothetical protein
MEKPFGLCFSDEDHQELVEIVDAYFKSEPLEGAAPFADDAQAWLAGVRTKATGFWRSLEPPASQREAAFFVQRLIPGNFREGQQSGPHMWNGHAGRRSQPALAYRESAHGHPTIPPESAGDERRGSDQALS